MAVGDDTRPGLYFPPSRYALKAGYAAGQGPHEASNRFAVLRGIAVIRGGVAANVDEPFTLALTGGSIIMQRLSVFKEPQFTRLFDLIRSAAALADIIIVSLHCHESGANRALPADFIPISRKR